MSQIVNNSRPVSSYPVQPSVKFKIRKKTGMSSLIESCILIIVCSIVSKEETCRKHKVIEEDLTFIYSIIHTCNFSLE